jgi:hypothetical protein
MNTTPLAKLDAGLLAIAQQTGASPQQILEAEKRVLKTICQKGPMPPEMADIVFRREQQAKNERLKSKFSLSEVCNVIYIPAVITHLAWTYADKVLRYCADHRIRETAEISRAVKLLHKGYTDYMLQDTKPADLRALQQQADLFADEHARDFLILWFSVNARYKQLYPDEPLVEMKTDAYICLLMCRYLISHTNRMDKLEASRGISSHNGSLHIIRALEDCMKAYCGKQLITPDDNINASMHIISLRMNAQDFFDKDEN